MSPDKKNFPSPSVSRLAFAAALAATALAALPAAAQRTPWYAGISGGESKVDSALVANRESTLSGASGIATAFDSKDTAWRALVGYRVHPNIAVEALYADYGRSRMGTRFVVPLGATQAGAVFTDRNVKGFGADVVLSWPLLEDFSVLGRVGYMRAESKATAQLSGDVVFSDGTPGTMRTNTSKEGVARYGLGVEWHFMKNAGMRLEWERLADVGKPFASGVSGSTGQADQDAYTVGVVFRF